MKHILSKNFINLRPILFCAIALAWGAGFCSLYFFNGDSLWWLFAVFAVFFILVFFNGKNWRKSLVFLSILCAFFALGFGSFAMRAQSYYTPFFGQGEYRVQATISEVRSDEKSSFILLQDAHVQGKRVDGMIILSVSQSSFQIGDNIEGMLFLSPQGKDSSTYNLVNNIRYRAITEKEVSVIGKSNNVFLRLRAYIKEILYKGLDKDVASVAYALTTGDSVEIDSSLLENIRKGGMAHIFAVSGLHIGLVYAGVDFICKLLKIKKGWKELVPLVFCAFFCSICSWHASAIRAFVVCAVLSILKILGWKKDSLEGGGLACGIVLLINPLQIISVGYQLSALAYLSICTFSSTISEFLQKAKIPYSIASSLSVTFSAQIGVFPILLSAFGYISLAGVFLNILLLPFFSVAFAILLFFTFLACIFPFALSFLLFLPQVLMKIFLSVFYLFDFSTFLLQGSFNLWATIFYFSCLLMLSDRVRLDKRIKMPCALMLAFCSILFLL